MTNNKSINIGKTERFLIHPTTIQLDEANLKVSNQILNFQKYQSEAIKSGAN